LSGTTIGDDQIGQRILEFLDRYSTLNTRYLSRQPGLASMYCRIFVTPDGERAIVGLNVEDNPQTPPTPEMVCNARLLTLDLYGGNQQIQAARLAKEAKIPVVVGDLRQLDHPILPFTEVAMLLPLRFGPAIQSLVRLRLCERCRQQAQVRSSSQMAQETYWSSNPMTSLGLSAHLAFQ
jgi:hypothetical protein